MAKIEWVYGVSETPCKTEARVELPNCRYHIEIAPGGWSVRGRSYCVRPTGRVAHFLGANRFIEKFRVMVEKPQQLDERYRRRGLARFIPGKGSDAATEIVSRVSPSLLRLSRRSVMAALLTAMMNG